MILSFQGLALWAKAMNEIGSEFWLNDRCESSSQLNLANNAIYLLSGRTALDYIIRDIKAKKQFSTIAMPSYCCESMMEPLLRNGVNVEFYDVEPQDDGLRLNNPSSSSDVVFLLDYFGYTNPELPRLAEQAKAAGKTVIYDGTHKLNGNPAVEAVADYAFCSYRKWLYSNTASVKKNSGMWNLDSTALLRNTRYENLRNEAAGFKQKYINGALVDKHDFLSRFTEAEELLDSDYVGYAAEPESVDRLQSMDIASLAEKRRRNAQRLIAGLASAALPWLSVPIKTVKPDDCPLFVPVLVKPTLRTKVRQKLIDYSIYCPVHWPLSEQHYRCGIEQHDQSLYKSELSLVCDQRYELSDMDRVVETLRTIGDTI